jgi:hypothetical protein
MGGAARVERTSSFMHLLLLPPPLSVGPETSLGALVHKTMHL